MPKKILAVDDNVAILEVLNEILKLEGYDVVLLDDGFSIFETIADVHPDLILLDVMLNGIDGRDICRTIKKDKECKDIPVILISASHTIERTLNDEGAPDDFIPKPFDIYNLVERINRQLVA